MKKIGILLLALTIFNTGYAVTNDAKKVPFTFNGYSPTSEAMVSQIAQTKVLNGSTISYPLFSGNSTVTKDMNKGMEKFISQYKGDKNKTYNVTYTVESNNDSFVSVLFKIVENNRQKNEMTTLYDAITFNTKNGLELTMKDLFVPGYDAALKSQVIDKFKQFGFSTIDTKKYKFDGLVKKQKFYLENDAIVLIFNKGEATTFGTEQAFIPFIITDLIGIIK